MKNVIVGTAGHIDHGKSALVRALTNIDPDRLKEEQARGITIDLGFAHWRSDDVNFAFVDVPGHERFVRNMLAGVGGFDAVILVVAADESVMPQTREHFEICRLLQIPAGLIVLTKSDLVDADTIELVRMEVRDLVAGSFLEQAPIVAASSRTGAGLDDVRAQLVALGRAARTRPATGPARLPVDRVFTMKGFGPVVTGTLVSGCIGQDDDLESLPGARRVKVRGIQVHGARQERATAGQRVALNVGGAETSDLGRGETLVTPGTFEPTRMLDAVVEVVASARALRHGARVRFHQGTSEVLGRVAISGLADVPRAGGTPVGGENRDAGSGGKDVPTAAHPEVVAEIRPGSRAYVRLRLESAAVVTRGDRYILRAYSPPTTIAGGEVLDPRPPRGGIRTAAIRGRFGCLATTDAAAVLALMVDEAGPGGFAITEAVSRAGLSPAVARQCIDDLTAARRAVQVGDRLFAVVVLKALGDRLLQSLGDYHRAQPLSEGMPREEARERLFARAGQGLFERVVADLAEANRIVARDRLALAGHRLALSEDEERARDAIELAFRQGGLKPPEPAVVVQVAGGDAALADRMLKLLLRQKVLVKVETLFFHEDALRGLREDMAALKRAQADARLDVAAFKDRYGITRKYAIPLLEYLDRERVTRRVGESRVIL